MKDGKSVGGHFLHDPESLLALSKSFLGPFPGCDIPVAASVSPPNSVFVKTEGTRVVERTTSTPVFIQCFVFKLMEKALFIEYI